MRVGKSRLQFVELLAGDLHSVIEVVASWRYCLRNRRFRGGRVWHYLNQLSLGALRLDRGKELANLGAIGIVIGKLPLLLACGLLRFLLLEVAGELNRFRTDVIS